MQTFFLCQPSLKHWPGGALGAIFYYHTHTDFCWLGLLSMLSAQVWRILLTDLALNFFLFQHTFWKTWVIYDHKVSSKLLKVYDYERKADFLHGCLFNMQIWKITELCYDNC